MIFIFYFVHVLLSDVDMFFFVSGFAGKLDYELEVVKENRMYHNEIDLETIIDKCIVSIKLL